MSSTSFRISVCIEPSKFLSISVPDAFHLRREKRIAAVSSAGVIWERKVHEAEVFTLWCSIWRAKVPLCDDGLLRRMRFFADCISEISCFVTLSTMSPLKVRRTGRPVPNSGWCARLSPEEPKSVDS